MTQKTNLLEDAERQSDDRSVALELALLAGIVHIAHAHAAGTVSDVLDDRLVSHVESAQSKD